MKGLKDLFIYEIKASMIFLCFWISLIIGLFFGLIQIWQLQSDLNLTKYYIQETANNALTIEQPILIQRSVSEFWKAFSEKKTSIVALEVHLNNSLISEVGNSKDDFSLLNYRLQRCSSDSQRDICISYLISPFRFVSNIILALIVIILSTIFVYLARRGIAIKNAAALTVPLEEEIFKISKVTEDFKNFSSEMSIHNLVPTELSSRAVPILEISLLSESYKDLLLHSQKYMKLKKSEELNSSLSLQAKQVAHDIRSPLSALNLVSSSLKDVPEEKRLMIKNAIQRINDIANDLLSKGKRNVSASDENLNPNVVQNNDFGKNQDAILLPALVDSLLSEKRIQYRDYINIRIESDFSNSFGAFVLANGTDLMRLLSNLINNAIEAFPENKGEVVVAVRVYKDKIQLIVKDNGKGIPPEILLKLGSVGVTYGKEGTQSGSGLGVYHAKKSIEELGGKFTISSQLGVGTMFVMILPRIESPSWFLPMIKLQPYTEIICVDDDSTIHQIWKERFDNLSTDRKNFVIKNFTSPADFINFVQRLSADELGRKIFLIDFEFLGHSVDGLELIEKLNLQEKAILVTSHYDETEVRRRCERLNVKILPKALAGFVPLEIEAELQIFDWVLIDDDELVHMTWKIAAAENKKIFIGFKTYKEFEYKQNIINFQSNIFIDSNLGENIKGEEVAKLIFARGFKNLYLATGYEVEQFDSMPFIRAVIGKEPPLNI